MANAILPEAGIAHVEELSDPYLLWFWNSNVRSTAIVLNSLVKASADPDAPIRPIVRWMMAARKNGRWGNTQENAHAMEALVAYYRRYEATVPDFTGGGHARRARAWRASSSGAARPRQPASEVPMAELAASGAGRNHAAADLHARRAPARSSTRARLRYAADALFQQGLDNGIRIERTLRAVCRERDAAGGDDLQGGRPVTRHADASADQGAPLRRRHRSAAGRLRAGGVVVRHHGAVDLARLQDAGQRAGVTGTTCWERGGFDHVERHDDRVQLFATRLAEGRHQFTYVVRATTAGTFRTAPARAEEMYEPEVFGRTATAVIEVQTVKRLIEHRLLRA